MEGVRFRVPEVRGLEVDRLTLEDTLVLELTAPVAGTIHYTLDGTEPTPTSPVAEGPLRLVPPPEGLEVAARVVLSDGRASTVRRARVRRGRLQRPVPVPASERLPGLRATIRIGATASVDSLPELAPGFTVAVPRVTLPEEAPDTAFGLVLRGYVRVPRTGVYTFYLTSDDGSMLRVGTEWVVRHDGLHVMWTRGGEVALRRGWHPIEVRYFQAGGRRGLRLEVEGPGVSRREVPAPWLAHGRLRPL